MSIKLAQELDVPVALIDADIRPILEDIVSAALETPLDTVFSFFPIEMTSSPDIGSLQTLLSSDSVDMAAIDASTDQLREVSPYAARRLIDDRNEYMAKRLWMLKEEGHNVAAVIGAGHASGIERLLEEYEETPPDENVSVPLRIPKSLEASEN